MTLDSRTVDDEWSRAPEHIGHDAARAEFQVENYVPRILSGTRVDTECARVTGRRGGLHEVARRVEEGTDIGLMSVPALRA